MNAQNPTSRPNFQWDDPLSLDTELTEEERLVRDTARDYCQAKLLPRVKDAFREEKTDPSIFREMGELGLLGPTIEGDGCAGASYVDYGLIAREVGGVDFGPPARSRVQQRRGQN